MDKLKVFNPFNLEQISELDWQISGDIEKAISDSYKLFKLGEIISKKCLYFHDYVLQCSYHASGVMKNDDRSGTCIKTDEAAAGGSDKRVRTLLGRYP